MCEHPGGQVTQLLAAAGNGDQGARERLWQLVYDELHRIAHHQVGQEHRRGSLQTTILVHEAYLRLTGGEGLHLSNRPQFFAAAAEAMRRIRVDDARRRGRLKRGEGQTAQTLPDDPAAAGPDPTEALAVDDALERLEAAAPRQAEIVKLRYFAGLTVDETAEALGISPRTVDSEWRLSRAWLHRELSSGDTSLCPPR